MGNCTLRHMWGNCLVLPQNVEPALQNDPSKSCEASDHSEKDFYIFVTKTWSEFEIKKR